MKREKGKEVDASGDVQHAQSYAIVGRAPDWMADEDFEYMRNVNRCKALHSNVISVRFSKSVFGLKALITNNNM